MKKKLQFRYPSAVRILKLTIGLDFFSIEKTCSLLFWKYLFLKKVLNQQLIKRMNNNFSYTTSTINLVIDFTELLSIIE